VVVGWGIPAFAGMTVGVPIIKGGCGYLRFQTTGSFWVGVPIIKGGCPVIKTGLLRLYGKIQ